jgi:hypothetical protein
MDARGHKRVVQQIDASWRRFRYESRCLQPIEMRERDRAEYEAMGIKIFGMICILEKNEEIAVLLESIRKGYHGQAVDRTAAALRLERIASSCHGTIAGNGGVEFY